MAKQDEYTRYTIRIPTPLYERIKAASGSKSVNAEIAATLAKEYPVRSFGDMNAFELLNYISAPSEWNEMKKRVALVNEELNDPMFSFDFRVTVNEDTGRLEATVRAVPKRKSSADDDS